MSGIDWGQVIRDIVAIVLIVMSVIGMVPILTTLYQFLLLPAHSWRNHYTRTSDYTPRVAVIIPAWNEGAVIGASIDRLMGLEYPEGSLRIYVVDDASTDDTPDVVQAKEREYPGSVYHLRREQGGQGKAHTLNHGIRHVLGERWMQALLIMDADVIYLPDSLRRMTRHLADPEVGAVTGYIREGSGEKNYLSRFIGLEYVIAQLAARRAQNVISAMACLAGGAQLHSRTNIEQLGGQIDTSSLAEDTVTTFETQLAGRRVVFEPYAVVLAEEPQRVGALWKQRLRWSRGNVQLTQRFRKLWFRRSKEHNLGSISFGLIWFSVFLLPVFMVLATIGIVGLFFLNSALAATVFQVFWVTVGCVYIFTIAYAAQLDPQMSRTAWRELLLFPGLISIVVLLSAFYPALITEVIPGWFGLEMNETAVLWFRVLSVFWVSLCMIAAWGAKGLDNLGAPNWLMALYVYVVGYGPILCVVTFDAYIKEARGASMAWDKTEKTGRVMA